MNAYIKYGWDKNVLNPYGGAQSPLPSSSGSVEPPSQSVAGNVSSRIPEDGFKNVTKAYSSPADVPHFKIGHIVTYFVNRTVCDGHPAEDLKSVNKSAENLFRCGHVQEIKVCSTIKFIFLRARCVPEMRKDRVYKLALALQTDNLDVVQAECGCAAGKGPHGSCKHIAALSYAFADFCHLGTTPEFLTCTDRLQQWNQPRAKRIDPIPVNQLGARRRELLPPRKKSSGANVIFDPRPLAYREPDPGALEELRCTLHTLKEPCALLSVLIPCTKKVAHDHCYITTEHNSVKHSSTKHPSFASAFDISLYLDVSTVTEQSVLKTLCLTAKQREELEKETKGQVGNNKWHDSRRYRITGSKCGRVLKQEMTVALLRCCIYSKPMLNALPKPISWGRNNEMAACHAYVKHMQTHGHPELKTSSSGFVVHPEKGWLGASLDAWVTDPSCNLTQGIAEFKCPYSKLDITPEKACEDPKFCCILLGDKIQLKRDHIYYHQVQLQLYVASDLCHWCDFCIYTTKGVAVERVFPDAAWKQIYCPVLDSFFFDCILPELVNPQHKPSYVL